MLPDAAGWRDATAYAYWDELTPEGLAWEFLRRNPEYQRAYSAGASRAANWGLRRPEDPSITAADTTIHWRPGLNTSEILIASQPVPALPTPSCPVDLAMPHDGTDGHGHFGVVGPPGAQLHVSHLGRPTNGTVPCIVIPLDGHLAERVDAINRLRRLLDGHPLPRPRLTREKRRRLGQMARAFDGRAAGGSHREIAQVLFGNRRMAAEVWKTSSLRYAVLRLLNDALEMTETGYLHLLRSSPPNRADFH